MSKTIRDFSIPETIDDNALSDISRLAAAICHTPPSLTGIIDIQKKCSKILAGSMVAATTDVLAFATDEILIVPDLTKNENFHSNALVTHSPHLVFYTGIPLASDGIVIGTLCIWDTQPGIVGPQQIEALQALARMVVGHYEQHKSSAQLKDQFNVLQQANSDLDSFANIAAHDLKSPLNAIISLTHLIKTNYATSLDEEGNEYIGFLSRAANNLTELVTGILSYSRHTHLVTESKEDINFTDLVEEVTELLEIPGNVSITYEKNEDHVYASRIALKQILLNLVDNAMKHSDKNQVSITIRFEEDTSSYSIGVRDNGPGIPAEDLEQIFDLFKPIHKKIKDGKDGGIGLSIVKKLVEKLNGVIQADSEIGIGTTFVITIPK